MASIQGQGTPSPLDTLTPKKIASPGGRKRLFYGWYLVGAGCALLFVQSALFLQSFGAYFAVLRDDRGWSKTELSGAAAMHQVEAAILGPLLGWFIDRFGAQWVIRAGVVIFGAGFILLSYVDSLLAYYGAFIVTALGGSLCGFFPLNVALIHWFERYRARALSSMQIGLPLGGLVLPVVAWSLAAWGWRATAFASGIIILAVCLPLSFVMRRRPEDVGEVMDGTGSRSRDSVSYRDEERQDTPRDFTAREALRTRAFWLLALGHGFERPEDVLPAGLLEHVARCAGPNGREQHLVFGVAREHDDFDLGQLRSDFAAGFDAARAGQANVHHHRIRLEGQALGHGLGRVGGFRDHLHVGVALDQGLEPEPHHFVIVYQYDSLSAHVLILHPLAFPANAARRSGAFQAEAGSDLSGSGRVRDPRLLSATGHGPAASKPAQPCPQSEVRPRPGVHLQARRDCFTIFRRWQVRRRPLLPQLERRTSGCWRCAKRPWPFPPICL